MNPLDAVEAVGGARAPLATLQALADALAAMAPQGPGMAEESGAPHAETAAQAVAQQPAEVLPPVLASEATTAVQGRMTLGQLATEQSALRSTPDSSGGEAARSALRAEPMMADAATAPRVSEMLAVPVLLNPLQPPATPPARPSETEAPPPRREARREPEDEAPPPEPEEDTEAANAEADGDLPQPEAAALHALLERERQADGLAELARGRRVLVVLPGSGAGHGVADATAWLVGPQAAQRFTARWWPGASKVDAAGWLQWRVFRDGDPLLSRGLASRAGGQACRVRLGAQALRLADAEAAGLEVGDRIRFSQTLGGQWSLLVLAAPAGTAP